MLIGDATGHGAGAALLTAVVKSFTATVELLSGAKTHNVELTLEQMLSLLNSVVCKACGGQLLMTMCIIELDTQSGAIKVCNAGHEWPLRLMGGVGGNPSMGVKGLSKRCQVLFARGERLVG